MKTAPQDLIVYLRAHAGEYYSELRGKDTDIRCLRVESRNRSRLYRFVVSSGSTSHRIIIKEPKRPEASPSGHGSNHFYPGRPRLVLPAEVRDRYLGEYATLRLIEQHLRRESDPIAVIRALDYLDSRCAIVMEELRAPTLRTLMARQSRLNLFRRASRLDFAFGNAGRWLSAYHALEVPAAKTRHSTRHEVLGFLEAIGDYLSATTREAYFFREVVETVKRSAERALPENLPLAVSHGDYAMRNLFVLADGRVASVDMWPRWRTAPYEDLAYFLVALRNTRAQLLSQGVLYKPKTLDAWEHAFLSGYGAVESVRLAVRTYELILLLDAWAARPVARPTDVRSLKWFLLDRAFRQEAERLLVNL